MPILPVVWEVLAFPIGVLKVDCNSRQIRH